MTDAEIRGRLLTQFHALRHSNGGWVPISDINLAPEAVELRVIGGVCQQLADLRLIQWRPLQGSNGIVAGTGKITGQGVAAVESGRSAGIDIRFPSETAPGVPSSAANASAVGSTSLQDALAGRDTSSLAYALGAANDPTQAQPTQQPSPLSPRSAEADREDSSARYSR